MYDQRKHNPSSGPNPQRPMTFPPLPPPPPTAAPITAQPYTRLSHIYPTYQHNSQHGLQNAYPNLQNFSSPPPSPSLVQPHLPPSSVFPRPPVASHGQALYRPPHTTSNYPSPFAFGNFGPPAGEKPVSEKLASENSPFYGRVLEQEGGSVSKMGSSVGDGVLSIGSSKPDQPLPLLKPIEVGSHTFADSDTEMEDDITQPDDDPGVNYSTGTPKCYSNLILGELDKEEQLTGLSASRGDHQPQIPVQGFNASNSYSQGNTISRTEQLLKETNADRSRKESSSPDSAKAQNFSESGGGDMYDPFLDSIEPHPNSFKNFSHVQQHEPTSDSNIIPRLGVSSSKPPDVEENDRGSDVGAIVPETSMDNEECGENGNPEAEVGSVETGSSDPPDDLADPNTNTGEVESGKKRSREKRKNKESRSMRLFKVVLTQFVKDLLKPSWRQGNMSKEAFKTIVKKTVDKVSGAMEGRRIPKSRAKIDRYIDSSQHKLTKLVMGYVDKYVKA